MSPDSGCGLGCHSPPRFSHSKFARPMFVGLGRGGGVILATRSSLTSQAASHTPLAQTSRPARQVRESGQTWSYASFVARRRGQLAAAFGFGRPQRSPARRDRDTADRQSPTPSVSSLLFPRVFQKRHQNMGNLIRRSRPAAPQRHKTRVDVLGQGLAWLGRHLALLRLPGHPLRRCLGLHRGPTNRFKHPKRASRRQLRRRHTQ